MSVPSLFRLCVQYIHKLNECTNAAVSLPQTVRDAFFEVTRRDIWTKKWASDNYHGNDVIFQQKWRGFAHQFHITSISCDFQWCQGVIGCTFMCHFCGKIFCGSHVNGSSHWHENCDDVHGKVPKKLKARRKLEDRHDALKNQLLFVKYQLAGIAREEIHIPEDDCFTSNPTRTSSLSSEGFHSLRCFLCKEIMDFIRSCPHQIAYDKQILNHCARQYPGMRLWDFEAILDLLVDTDQLKVRDVEENVYYIPEKTEKDDCCKFCGKWTTKREYCVECREYSCPECIPSSLIQFKCKCSQSWCKECAHELEIEKICPNCAVPSWNFCDSRI